LASSCFTIDAIDDRALLLQQCQGAGLCRGTDAVIYKQTLLLLLLQVAKQQGEFLAEVLVGGQWEKRSAQLAMKPQQPAFKYFHKGSLVSEDLVPTSAVVWCMLYVVVHCVCCCEATAASLQVLQQGQPGERIP
jgi:hypothetical protein